MVAFLCSSSRFLFRGASPSPLGGMGVPQALFKKSLLSGPFAPAPSARNFSFFSSQKTLPKACHRLTDAIVTSKALTGFSEAIDRWDKELEAWEEQVNFPLSAPVYFWVNRRSKKMVVHFRNELSRLLMADDSLRSGKGGCLAEALSSGERCALLEQIKRLKRLVGRVEPSIEKKELLGGLVRSCTALEIRLGATEEELSSSERERLKRIATDLRVKQAKHLKHSALLQLDRGRLEKAREVPRGERIDYLDDLFPLELGLSHRALRRFILELTPQARAILLPLFGEREAAIHCDDVWNRQIDCRHREGDELERCLQAAEREAERDVEILSKSPLAARLLLDYQPLFVDDLYRSHYLLKFIPLLGYFHSPHVSILFDEQHLNKQMKAAGEALEEAAGSPFCLIPVNLYDGT